MGLNTYRIDAECLNGAMSENVFEGYRYNNSMGEFISLALGQKGRQSLLEVLTH